MKINGDDSEDEREFTISASANDESTPNRKEGYLAAQGRRCIVREHTASEKLRS